MQAGIPMGKKWELNPFVLGAVFAGDGCANYIVTRQGADNGLSRVSSKSCSEHATVRLLTFSWHYGR